MTAALDQIRIVLCQTSHPGNIGAAARAMKTMGLNRLFLVAPKRYPDPEAEAMSAGASDLLAQATVCTTLQEALAGCSLVIGLSARKRELTHELVSARAAAIEAVTHAAHAPVALVVGNETSGLSNAELIQCQRLAMVPANPAYSSLNLAAAVQILAYELRQQALAPMQENEPAHRLATHEEIEGLYQHLETTLVSTGYLNPDQPKRLMPRLRRLFGRARLEKEEINLLRGILKSIRR